VASTTASFEGQEAASLEFTKACSIVAGTVVDTRVDSTVRDTDTDTAVVNTRYTRVGRSRFVTYKATTSTRRIGQARGPLRLVFPK